MSALQTQFNWTHYKTLIGLDNKDKREFYIAEAAKNNWSARQLERQVNSQLYLPTEQQFIEEVKKEIEKLDQATNKDPLKQRLGY